ncbi:molybdopterin synthase catalytic subunit MoaE [Aestuariibacter halophilus]|uniref:Molybdopterin synthase catalytic subunit n=1 Tax=Fluctibacter halophilus TaxID=226011 RepID=A0ABS8G756_9ALTE|nr:molybdopterin synthase catalytic subunit MoaE [Aestuariibacter halophilus]MCC2615061.1 molybdopterin synthase catalytic subunit MoaE [Aestuariibacter halophilus]
MIVIQPEDFDHGEQYKRLRARCDSDGAIVTFTGLVRDFCHHGRVSTITLEHYPGMAEKSLMQICAQARKRWELGEVTVIHRVGELSAHEQIVFVGVTSKHRQAAFEAAEFIMDYLKTLAPFWKKETTNHGPHWVDAKASDQVAFEKW